VLKILQDARTNKAIAADYGVSVSTIKGVRNGRTWKAVYKRHVCTELVSDACDASVGSSTESTRDNTRSVKTKVGLPVDQLFEF